MSINDQELSDWAWQVYVGVDGEIDPESRTCMEERRYVYYTLYGLSAAEFEIVKTFITDGWRGTFHDLIAVAKELA